MLILIDYRLDLNAADSGVQQKILQCEANPNVEKDKSCMQCWGKYIFNVNLKISKKNKVYLIRYVFSVICYKTETFELLYFNNMCYFFVS